MTDCQLVYLSRQDILQGWGWIEPLLERGFQKAPGSLSPEELQRQAMAGRTALWAVIDKSNQPVAVAGVRKLPGSVAEMFALSGRTGSLRDVMPLWPVFEEACRRVGVTAVRVVGRKGWLRRLPGFAVVSVEGNRVVMEKAL